MQPGTTKQNNGLDPTKLMNMVVEKLKKLKSLVLHHTKREQMSKMMILVRIQTNNVWTRLIKINQQRPVVVTILMVWCMIAAFFNVTRRLTTRLTTSAGGGVRGQQQSHLIAEYYVPSKFEEVIMNLDQRPPFNYKDENVKACQIINDKSASDIHDELQQYINELDRYTEKVKNFNLNITDIRDHIDNKDKSFCNKLDIVGGDRNNDDDNTFTKNYLSITNNGGGYIEPLLPSMRHPKFCKDSQKYLVDTSFIIHDFNAICYNKIKKSSKTIFIDVGNPTKTLFGNNLSFNLIDLYKRFGIKFDHVYAIGHTRKNNANNDLYNTIPEDLLTSFHYMDIDIDVNPNSKQNPWNAFLSKFQEDDFIIIKLDINFQWEGPLVEQLLQNEKYSKLVDHFYFQHHVHVQEMNDAWGNTVKGTLRDSLDLFTKLRQKGIAAHYWV